MIAKTCLHRLGGAAVLAIVLLPGLATAAEKEDTNINLDGLRRQTVRIQVKPEDGPEENGSGVLLCKVANQAYVLTANHVLFGHDPTGKPRTSLDLKEIRISFYKDEAPAVVEEPQSETRRDVIGKVPVGNKDLLLLSFEVPEELASTAKPGTPPTAAELESRNDTQRPGILAIGYSQPSSTSWVEVKGSLRERTGDFLIHDAPIVPGFSGGPLFDEAGALLGINVQETGSGGGNALPIDEVLAAIDKWVPAVCLRNADQEQKEESAAQNAYREAMRQVSLQNWTKAKDWLDKALEHKKLEGGSVHLQGMRYTEYLPYYHLGLVYFHQQQYGKALNALAISDVQGVVQGNKRYKNLKKLRKECERRLSQKAD